MTEKTWILPFLQALREMSDVSAQRRAWIAGDLPNFPAPGELVCQVFDDSGLDDELAAGTVFSPTADNLLRELSSAVAGVDVSQEPERLLDATAWTRVTDLARQALTEISEIQERCQ